MISSPFRPYRLKFHRVYSSLVSRRWVAGAVSLISVFFLAVYLAQHATLAPNDADGALILEYIRMMSHGARPFFDFVDVYGPVNWILPVFFFMISGKHVLGIRIFLIVLKLFMILMTFAVVKRLGSRFFAILAALTMAVIWGQPWQYLQTAYAAHTSFLLVLCTMYFLLATPFKKEAVNLSMAGVFTALTFWTKLNSGMFLLAGGLFYCFYWVPVPVAPDKPPEKKQAWIMGIQFLGLAFYGGVFHAYIAPYFNKSYFLYLSLPVCAFLLQTIFQVREERGDLRIFIKRFNSWLIYLAGFFLAALSMYVIYFGWTDGKQYWGELLGILIRLDYMSPFPPFWMPGLYGGFNTFAWMQLPWLATFLFLLYMSMQRHPAAARTFRGQNRQVNARVTGAFVIFSLLSFSIYSRSDETHIYQAVVPAVPMVFILLSTLEKQWMHGRIQWRKPFRLIMATGVAAVVSTIFSLPGGAMPQLPLNDWNTENLKGIRMTTRHRYIFFMGDTLANELSRYVDDITEDWSPVLVLNENQMINYNSKTVPVGGRYQYLFYMLRSDLLDRKAFDELVPPSVLASILEDPPDVIVNSHRHTSLLKHIPEFETLLQERYVKTRTFGYLFVYEKISG